MAAHSSEAATTQHGFLEILNAFVRLGLTSFGGPTAHIGYFRTAFVERRGWLTAETFGQYFAFASLLPGPTSSQLGMLVGLHRGGLRGAAAAWLGFTLPSAFLMLTAGLLGLGLLGNAEGLLKGLAAAAVGVVAHAVWGMVRGLCPDLRRRLIAIAGFVITAAIAGAPGQFLTLAIGAGLGWLALKDLAADAPAFEPAPLPRRVSQTALVALGGVLVVTLGLVLGGATGLFGLVGGILYSGTFIVGGGHVVLPLLESTVVQPGHLSSELFLAGYGLAQAVPGPLFTISAFLGAAAPSGGLVVSLVCLVAIFLPSTLLMLAALPHWQELQKLPAMRPALAGMSAAVTGLLAAALVFLLIPKAITSVATALIALAVLAFVFSGRVPAWVTVLVAAAGGALLDLVGLL